MALNTIRAASGRWLESKPFMGRLWLWVKQHPWLAAIVAVVVAATGIFVAGSFSRTNSVQHSYYTIKRGDFLISVIEGGTLRALKESSIRSEVESSTKIITIVPEGTYVHKGDLLVELDASQIKESLDSQEITLENSRFTLVQGQEQLDIQKSLVESTIKDAELKVEIAKSDLEKYLEGDWPQLKNDAESRITLAAEELERARDRLNWTQVLQQKGYATKSEMQADSLSVKQKEVALAQAKEAQQLLIKYDHPKKKRLLEAYVESYEKELERLKQRSAGQIAQSEADLTARKRTLAMQQEKLDELKKQMEVTKIYAPTDGLVVYSTGSSYSGVLIEEGASVRFRQEIIKLPDITQMVIEIRVHESHITKIRPGQTAYITIDSMPDLRLKGRVYKVAVLPDSSSRFYNPTLKVYPTEVLIEDPLPSELKPGVSGRAEVVITNLQNVLAVPLQAVASVKGEQVCFVGRGPVPRKVPVEVGLYNDKFIEIKSGLKEGDEMLLAPMLVESDEIDLSGSIVDANEYEADRQAAAKKSREARKGAGKASPKTPAQKPPTALETLRQPLKDLRRAAETMRVAPSDFRPSRPPPPDAGSATDRKPGPTP